MDRPPRSFIFFFYLESDHGFKNQLAVGAVAFSRIEKADLLFCLREIGFFFKLRAGNLVKPAIQSATKSYCFSTAFPVALGPDRTQWRE